MQLFFCLKIVYICFSIKPTFIRDHGSSKARNDGLFNAIFFFFLLIMYGVANFYSAYMALPTESIHWFTSMNLLIPFFKTHENLWSHFKWVACFINKLNADKAYVPIRRLKQFIIMPLYAVHWMTCFISDVYNYSTTRRNVCYVLDHRNSSGVYWTKRELASALPCQTVILKTTFDNKLYRIKPNHKQ